MAINLYYWDIRGLNEPILNLLEYCGTPYVFHKVTSRDAWNQQKEDLIKKGCEFPNLPMIEKNGKYFSESVALLAFVATETDHLELLPNQNNMVAFLEYLGVANDLNGSATGPAYGCQTIDEFRHVAGENLKRHFPKLKAISDSLGKQAWLLGDQLSILDFRFAEFLERLKAMDKTVGFNSFGLDFSNFDKYLERFLSLKGIKEFRASDKFVQRPWNNTMAVWK